MLCTSVPCRRRNVAATRSLRWRYKNDPPGDRPQNVGEGRYCDTCADSIRQRHADVVLMDEPIESYPVDRETLQALAMYARDDNLTYEALTALGMDGPEAHFVSELVKHWQAIATQLAAGPSPNAEVVE